MGLQPYLTSTLSACTILYFHVFVSACTIFLHIISQRTQFQIKKYLNIKFFIFLKVPSEKFIFRRRICHRVVLHIGLSLCNYPLSTSEISKTCSFSTSIANLSIFSFFLNLNNAGQNIRVNRRMDEQLSRN